MFYTEPHSIVLISDPLLHWGDICRFQWKLNSCSYFWTNDWAKFMIKDNWLIMTETLWSIRNWEDRVWVFVWLPDIMHWMRSWMIVCVNYASLFLQFNLAPDQSCVQTFNIMLWSHQCLMCIDQSPSTLIVHCDRYTIYMQRNVQKGLDRQDIWWMSDDLCLRHQIPWPHSTVHHWSTTCLVSGMLYPLLRAWW